MIDGKRLRELRVSQGYSRRELSVKTDIAESQLARYEMEQNDATGDALARIATFFNVSTDYLLGLTDNPSPKVGEEFRPEEVAVIAAWRRGDFLQVMKIMSSKV
jgi:transcriptional regulator with XRE-family HTH domain